MKDKVHKKLRLSVRIVIGLALFVCAMMFIPNIMNNSENEWKASQQVEKGDIKGATKELGTAVTINRSNDPTIEPEQVSASLMEVHFIDVGQGDSILIQSAGKYMLIDAGDNNKGDAVVNYLKAEGVETLTYVIGTHPHADHIGGLDRVIESFEVEKLIMPNASSDTQTFEDVLTAISDKGLKITTPKVGVEYAIGKAKFTIIAPNETSYSNLNNYSVAIKLENGNDSFVMCGDAEIEAEYDILDNGIDISADVLKLGHHGSDTATSEGILKAVNPTYAIICVGADNKYGHPYNETLQKMISNDIQVFRTDLQGNIIASSDGENITFNTEPATLELVEATPKPTQVPTELPTDELAKEDSKDITVYVTETGEKYHRDGCQFLNKNKIAIDLQDAKKTYEPCSRCNPPE